jgi:uncharacterized protein Veg
MVEALSLEVIQWRTRTLKNTREFDLSKSGRKIGVRLTVDVTAHQTYPSWFTVQNHDNSEVTRRESVCSLDTFKAIDSHNT